MKDFLEIWPMWIFFLFVVFSCIRIEHADAQKAKFIPCPINGILTFTAPLEYFETSCDNVEFHEDGIIVPRFCPYTAKIKGQEAHTWIYAPCILHLRYFKDQSTI